MIHLPAEHDEHEHTGDSPVEHDEHEHTERDLPAEHDDHEYTGDSPVEHDDHGHTGDSPVEHDKHEHTEGDLPAEHDDHKQAGGSLHHSVEEKAHMEREGQTAGHQVQGVVGQAVCKPVCEDGRLVGGGKK